MGTEVLKELVVHSRGHSTTQHGIGTKSDPNHIAKLYNNVHKLCWREINCIINQAGSWEQQGPGLGLCLENFIFINYIPQLVSVLIFSWIGPL